MKLLIPRSQFLILVATLAVAVALASWRIWIIRAPTSKPSSEVVAPYDWKMNNAKLAGIAWLKEGKQLIGAKPSRVSFSPNGYFLVGGALTPAMWNARTGQYQGSFGNFEYSRIDFLTNNRVAITSKHNLNIYGSDFKQKHRSLKRTPYRGMSFPAVPTEKGAWVYAPDIYAGHNITTGPRLKYRLRFLDVVSGKFTRNLPISLTEASYYRPIFVVDRGSRIGVLQRGLRMFVLDENYNVVWYEQLAFEYYEDDPDYVPINPNPLGHSRIYDFDLTTDKRLLLLDRDKGLRQINLRTGKEVKLYPLPENATKLAVSKSGKLWAFGDKSGRFLLVDADKRKLLANVILPFTTEYLTFSPDEKSIAVGGLVILPISNFTAPVEPK